MAHSSKILQCAFVLVLGITLALGIAAKPVPDSPQAELKLVLSSPTMMLCLGSPLPLEMQLINQGDREVRIDKSELWTGFSYGFSRPDGSGGGGGEASSWISDRDVVVLKPGENYVSSFQYQLAGSFFNDAGGYVFKTNYQHVSSNEITFELYDCNPQ
jgi:hypothetical protein